MFKMLTLKKNIDQRQTSSTSCGPRTHGILAHAQIKMLLTVKARLVLIVVNSIKLYLTDKQTKFTVLAEVTLHTCMMVYNIASHTTDSIHVHVPLL